LDSDRVVLDTVKLAEDGKGMVVRVYEAHGGRGFVTLNFGFDVTEGCECDCLERPIGPVAVKGNAFTFSVTPFEIKTFRVVPA